MSNIDWHYFQQFASYVLIPLLVSFIKSERMALDKSTQANGLYHWYKLACQALAVVPQSDIKQLDVIIPGAEQVLEALTDPKQ